MLSEIGDADNNANNFGAMPISRVGNGRKFVVDGRIVKILTKTGIDNTKEILTGSDGLAVGGGSIGEFDIITQDFGDFLPKLESIN